MHTMAALDQVLVSTLQSRKGFKAACEARFVSCLHYLPARASSRPAQGWISWHTFERKALRVVLHTSAPIIGCPVWHVARASQHMPGPELSVYYTCPLWHITYLTVGKKAIWDQWLLFHARRAMWTWGSRSRANCWLQSTAGSGSKSMCLPNTFFRSWRGIHWTDAILSK